MRAFYFDPLGFVPGSVIGKKAERSNSRKKGVGTPREALRRQVGAFKNFLVRPKRPF